ncbi:MAG: hypothetical protein ACRDTD_17240 [Pseudonocardiaceae bacterium]
MPSAENRVDLDAEVQEYVELADKAAREAVRGSRWWNRAVVAGQVAQVNASLAVLTELRALRAALVPAPEPPPPLRPEAQF